MHTTTDLILVAIATFGITLIIVGWVYEYFIVPRIAHDLELDFNQLEADFEDAKLENFQLRAEVTSLHYRDHWSFGDSLGYGNGLSRTDMQPLFDADLMLGNND